MTLRAKTYCKFTRPNDSTCRFRSSILRFAPAFVAVLGVMLQGSSSRAVGAERALFNAAINSIEADDLQRHVDVLADDTFEGREAGSRGGRAAGNYLMQFMAKHGLQGGGEDGGYFQPFGENYRNILGLLPGADEALRGEVIIIGAHYDHVGYGSPRNSFGPTGYIHNGADDNASGTAGLLELIEAFSMLGDAPARSVLFAFWDGEEKGLLGSKQWVGNPTAPLDSIVAAINLDMIGRLRNDRVEIFGSRTARGFRRLLSRHNGDADLLLDFSWEMKGNSDHYTFYQHDIPSLMLHTGLHDDYHRPSDDAHKVNAAGAQRVMRLLFSAALELADQKNEVTFRSRSREEGPVARRRLEQPLPANPPRLGVMWKTPGEGESGLLLSQVTVDSPAWLAGLRAGDRLTHFANQEIDDPDQFRAAVLIAQAPVAAKVLKKDQKEATDVKIELRGRPVRLGIAWRVDEGEPGAVLLTQVVAGSAAHQAGLRVGDRIYQAAGRDFADSDEFFKLVTTLASPLELTYERSGRISQASLNLPAMQQVKPKVIEAVEAK